MLGIIGSHVDITSRRKGHQANTEAGAFRAELVLWAFSPGILPDGGAFRDGQLSVGALPSRNIGKMSTDHPTLLHDSVHAASLEKHDPPVAK